MLTICGGFKNDQTSLLKGESMLHKFNITPYAIILCLFGLTLITVSPVFAEDSPEFVACQQIKPHGNFNLMKQRKKICPLKMWMR